MGFVGFFVQISVFVCGKFLLVRRAEWVLISIFFLFEMLGMDN
jgi:hypothetical protein